MVKIILCKDVKNLGNRWSVVEVKKLGYAKYLLREKKGIEADRGKDILLQHAKLVEKEKLFHQKDEEKALQQKLEIEKKTLVWFIDRERLDSDNKNKIKFGSLTKEQLAKKIAEDWEIKLKGKDVLISHPIKSIGRHDGIDIRLSGSVIAKLSLLVKVRLM